MKNVLLYALAATLLFSACGSGSSEKKTLPVYGNPIPPFRFVNQYGDSVSEKTLNQKIYVVDFFFTTCPSICPIMQRNMLSVYRAFENKPGFKIISNTIDPKHDSVPVLKKYAEKLGVSGNTWWFLQGKKEDVYTIAEKSYLVAVKQDSGTPGGYIHAGYFVLIDKQKRIRGYYDGTDPKQVDQLITDIKTLLNEPGQTTGQ